MTVEAKDLSISKKNFPDAYVRKVLKKQDKNHDGKLSRKEQKEIEDIMFKKRKSVNLKGLSKLPNLDAVSISKCKIKSISELSRVKKLQWLDLNDTNIQSLNLKTSKLKDVYLNNNSQLISVNLSGVKTLESVQCKNNKVLKSLNMQNCKKVKDIEDSGNVKLVQFNLLGDSLIENLNVEFCEGRQMRMSTNKEISELTIHNYNGNGFDFSKTPCLSYLNLYNSILDDSIFQKMPKIRTLNLVKCNSVKQPAFNTLTKLSTLYVDSCHFGNTLDLNGLTKLDKLTWYNSSLESISFGNANLISELDLSNNKLKGDLKIDFLRFLKDINLSNNDLSSLVLSGCAKGMTTTCMNNKNMGVIDLTQCADISSCDITGCPYAELFVFGNSYFDGRSNLDLKNDSTAVIHYITKDYSSYDNGLKM